jgi:hypothetical protein
MKWREIDMKDPWAGGVNVISRTVVDGKVSWVGAQAKKGRRKPKALTPKEQAKVKKLLRGQGYEGPWGEAKANNGEAPQPKQRRRSGTRRAK